MKLELLYAELESIHAAQWKEEFSILIRKARDALGLKQYYAAKLMGMTKDRLKNLETEFFSALPDENEIKALSKMYDLDIKNLQRKVEKFVYEKSGKTHCRKNSKKIVHVRDRRNKKTNTTETTRAHERAE